MEVWLCRVEGWSGSEAVAAALLVGAGDGELGSDDTLFPDSEAT